MGAQIITGCEKYLGLPMVGGKSKFSTFKELQEKVIKRVMGWKEKHISKAGREVLIKTIAQVIPTYSMSIFKIPKLVCDGINSTLFKYWWGQTRDEKKIHWINWGRLCTLKGREEWGFGTYMPLTWLCWQSRHGALSMKRTHCFTVCTRPTIFPHVLLWM